MRECAANGPCGGGDAGRPRARGNRTGGERTSTVGGRRWRPPVGCPSCSSGDRAGGTQTRMARVCRGCAGRAPAARLFPPPAVLSRWTASRADDFSPSRCPCLLLSGPRAGAHHVGPVFFFFWRAGEAATTGGGESPPAVCHGRERRRVEGASRSPPPRAASVVTPPQPTGARGGKAGAIQLWASGGDAPPPPRSGCLCRARVARGAARDRLPAKNKNTKTEAASPLPACQGANSCSSRIFVLRVRRDAGRGHRRPPGTLPRQRCSASVAPPASKGRGYATCQYQPPISHAHSRRAHPKVRRVRTSRVWITAAERRTTRDGWRVVAAAPRGEKRSRADAR